MTTVLKRLLRYPHAAVFDKDPAAELALRVRHPDGAAWSVADEQLTVTAGAMTRTYDLADLTVGDLVDALESDGFEVPAIGEGWASRSALALVEGDGNQFASNGDRLQAFTSLLWALMSGYAVEVRTAGRQVQEALRQMVLTTSEGEWLDLWGTLYGVARLDGETDADYAPRIVREVFRERVNGHGIEKAILDATGYDVRIEEPWKDLFILDDSVLSGPHRLYDGVRYGYHLIRPFTRQSVDWDKVRPVIDRNRAAGVMVSEYHVVHGAYTNAGDGGLVYFQGYKQHSQSILYDDRAMLDFMAIEDRSIPNYPARRIRITLIRSQSTYDDSGLAVISKQQRSFRSYLSYANYVDQYWLPGSWAATEGTWNIDAAVLSAHTRS